MEPNEQNIEQAQPKRPSILRTLLTGSALGAGIGLIISYLTKKASRKDHVLLGALEGGLLALLLSSTRSTQPKPPELPMTTPVFPPAAPATPQPQGLALAGVPQILDILVSEGNLTPEHHAQVMHAIQSGRKGFAAEIALSDGYITQEIANAALIEQTARKAQAAVMDIQTIATLGTQPAPAWLKANWGNNGVNPAIANPTKADGISAAANIAQNLTLLANANPAQALALQPGILAAANLSRGIALGDSPVTPLKKMAAQWRDTMVQALQTAAAANPQAMVDSQGHPIDINAYIAARSAEVTSAVAQTLAAGQDRGNGQAR